MKLMLRLLKQSYCLRGRKLSDHLACLKSLFLSNREANDPSANLRTDRCLITFYAAAGVNGTKSSSPSHIHPHEQMAPLC